SSTMFLEFRKYFSASSTAADRKQLADRGGPVSWSVHDELGRSSSGVHLAVRGGPGAVPVDRRRRLLPDPRSSIGIATSTAPCAKPGPPAPPGSRTHPHAPWRAKPTPVGSPAPPPTPSWLLPVTPAPRRTSPALPG